MQWPLSLPDPTSQKKEGRKNDGKMVMLKRMPTSVEAALKATGVTEGTILKKGMGKGLEKPT